MGVQGQDRPEVDARRNQSTSVPRDKASHPRRIGQKRLDEEQNRKSCLQKDEQEREKGLQRDPEVDLSRTKARANLGITGWYSVKKGTALYKEAKKIYGA